MKQTKREAFGTVDKIKYILVFSKRGNSLVFNLNLNNLDTISKVCV